MTPISDFYVPIRLLLGDLDANQIFQYQDAAIDGAVRAVMRFGLGPEGYELDGAPNSANAITPELPNGSEFAIIAYQAALILIGGEVSGGSWRTRALSVTESSDRPKSLMAELRTKIYRIDAGDGFATYQSFIVWLVSAGGLYDNVAVRGMIPELTVGDGFFGALIPR